jgi:hypothetical protein
MKIIQISLILFLPSLVSPETHVFWYKAITNGYNLQAGHDGKGPCLPSNITVHEGMMATGHLAQMSGQNGNIFAVGSGADSVQGRCGWFWSKDLCRMTGSVTKATFRGEYRDGAEFCDSGPVIIHRGVADYQPNLDNWGGVDSVPTTANWKDDANLISSEMGFGGTDHNLKASDTVQVRAPLGRFSGLEPSLLDSQFMELDCTPQVNWILSHSKESGEQSLSGQYAIVFLVAQRKSGIGKMNIYSSEDCPGAASLLGSDHPWTQDGNTAHLVLEGNLTSVEKPSTALPSPGMALLQNFPNPFNPATSVNYFIPDRQKGFLSLYASDGSLISTQPVQGAGALHWDAGKRASGVYLCKLAIGRKVYVKKMMLMR